MIEKVIIAQNRKKYKRKGQNSMKQKEMWKGKNSIEYKGIRQKRLEQYRIERNIKKSKNSIEQK